MIPTTRIKGEINKENIRKMTPREWARLQGFPDDYKLTLADASLYKQFGNSVTVNVIEAIAKEIRKIITVASASRNMNTRFYHFLRKKAGNIFPARMLCAIQRAMSL